MAQRLHSEMDNSKPMDVQQVVQEAQFEYNPLVPLRYWLRTAGTILKEAEIYEREGNDQQTYLLLYRHAQLVVGNLSSHPDAKQAEFRATLAQARKNVQRSFLKLEVLRPRINNRYKRYEQLLRDRDSSKASVGSGEEARTQARKESFQRGVHTLLVSEPAKAGDTEPLAAGENRDLAVRLAHKEIRRRAKARKATRLAGVPEEVEHERRTAGVWGDWEEAFTKDDDGIDRDDLSKQIQSVRSQVDGSPGADARKGRLRRSVESQRPRYHYPTVPGQNAHEVWVPSFVSPSLRDSSPQGRSKSPTAPALPPKHDLHSNGHAPPPRPDKEIIIPSNVPAVSPGHLHQQQDPNPSTVTFKPSAYLENGTPLRTIFLPPDLRHRFLSIASPNTRANLETCGILCGTLISNALFVSKLVIPDQESTSDTCETINESDLFDYVDGEDLMVLGWIHTHPTQTCFMSSRDLHTHGGYQVMMPESIAVVCAPSKGDWGVFRLTDPPGIKTMLNCTQTGLFHPHAESNIYTDALRPGHVHELKGLEFDVVDLR